MKIPICAGTKNKFVFLHEDQLLDPVFLKMCEVQKPLSMAQWCCEKLGSGADGLVIVKKSKDVSEVDYVWDFYNKDGSSAEMCGNASRCLGFFVKNYLNDNRIEIRFLTRAGVVSVKRTSDDIFSVKMPSFRKISGWVEEKIEGKQVLFCAYDTGVPHAVVLVDSLTRETLIPIARHFRFHAIFDKSGANVSFLAKKDDLFEGVTFERGVEGFTESCGTGVVAMAVSLFQQNQDSPNSTGLKSIKTPGGVLSVELDSSGKFCWLIGPAGLEEEIELY